MSDFVTKAVPAIFVVLWATGLIAARYATPWAEPFSFLWVRFALSFALLLLLVPVVRARNLSPSAASHACIAGMLMHGVYLCGIFWAIRNGMSAGLAGLIVGLQPLITAVLAGAFAGESLDRRLWVGLATGLAGVAIVLSPALASSTGGVTTITVGAALAAVIGMSAGTIWQKRFVAEADLVSATLYQYLGGWLVAFPAALLLEDNRFVLSAELVLSMAWLVLVLSLGAILLLMVLIRRGAVARVASLFYLVPAVTAIMDWALFGETLSPVQILGMGITMVGVALAARQPVTARRPR